jgi:hypothetical protein
MRAESHNVRVRTSVGHGEQTGLGVIQLEVLVGELLSVDGLATSALQHFCQPHSPGEDKLLKT